MTEQELRTLVREVIARQSLVSGRSPAGGPGQGASDFPTMRLHPSHSLFPVPAGAEIEGPCVIEPTVQCNHCGYCKSWGH